MNQAIKTEVIAATAADENYVVPLAVTVLSAIKSLSPETSLRLFILDGGITPDSKRRLMKSWNDPRVRIEWLKPDFSSIQYLPVSNHLSTCAYLRLLLPDLLPAEVGKLIYFDSDMLVRRDLGQLYTVPMEANQLFAVQEMAAPWMDSEIAISDYSVRRKFISVAQPVANYQELGIRAEAAYFNTGLLVFDVGYWREHRIAEQVLECLEKNREHVLWCDQYALNVIFADAWQSLDVRWNQTAGTFEYPSWRESPLDEAQYRQLCENPWIVHFCSPTKPWHYFCDHPFRQEFFNVLAESSWHDWRPDPPSNLAYKRWRYYRLKIRKSFRCAKANARNAWIGEIGDVA